MHRWDPETYEKSSSAQQTWAQELLSKISIRGDERILDIGCGDGKITAEISRLVPRGSVVGVDSSLEMLNFARSRFPDELWPNLEFQHQDARDLPYHDQFDLILSFAALHWILDHRPVLAGIRRSLKSEGRVFMQFGGRGNAASVLDLAGEMIDEEKWYPYFEGFQFPYGFYGPEEYRAWLDESGLRAVRVELLHKDMVQKDKAGLASWIESTWLPYIQRVPVEMRSDFIHEVVDRYIQLHPLDENGDVHVGMVRLEVEARKSDSDNKLNRSD
ncbi:methyltransferase domain-containing protein [Methanothrix soehngenii]|jgi:trans-aconitate methyltransferase|uniref:class I SAM-dependent methyltransferase n=1 Tax=Methanothrix soehngenii TaxID=2223 RepID=UPI002C0C6C06|nr:methyltransferase domain-containing protein [Methanothrix soehngenii]HPY93735.1 methyltransferase domain-containing protein [Methanothrix soehngenii]